MDNSLAQSLSKLNISQGNNDLAHAYGLKIQSTCWEDSSRTKNSCWGPNISDMTLTVDERRMCMIRKPNFSDVTCDLPIEDFAVTVGNETEDGQLKRIKLREYIESIEEFNKETAFDHGREKASLLKDRDEHLLASAQACVLPLESSNLKDKTDQTAGQEVEFVPELFNYQSKSGIPAVLVIVASSQGTSAAVISSRTQKLYFNRGGQAAQFLAKRLSRDRFERGVKIEGEMTEEEQDRNLIMIFQIPLQQSSSRSISQTENWNASVPQSNFFEAQVSKSKFYGIPSKGALKSDNFDTFADEDSEGDEDEDMDMGFGFDDCVVPQSSGLMEKLSASSSRPRSCSFTSKSASIKSKPKKGGMENAMLRVSDKSRGTYKGLENTRLKRDERFPIRVTMQHYKVSDSRDLKEGDVEYIANKINAIYDQAKQCGSLVVEGGSSDRPTATVPVKLRQLKTGSDMHNKPLFGGMASCRDADGWFSVNDADVKAG